MSPDYVIFVSKETLMTAMKILVPILGGGLLVGLTIGVFQAVTQINEMTLTFIPKMAIVGFIILFLMPWFIDIVVAFTQAIVAGQMQTYHALNAGRATALAEAMLEEVLAQPYADPSGTLADVGTLTEGAMPEAQIPSISAADIPGTLPDPDDRTAYTSINDFDGLVEYPTQVEDAAGNTLPDTFQGFTRSVRVVQAALDIAAMGTAPDGVLVMVVVGEPHGREWQITRFVPAPSEDG